MMLFLSHGSQVASPTGRAVYPGVRIISVFLAHSVNRNNLPFMKRAKVKPFYPVTPDGKRPAFSPTLAPVTEHRFADVPPWRSGMISQDRMPDGAAKHYLAVADMMEFVEENIIQGEQDYHLNEVLAADRPVRPYMDLEWDPAALDNGDEHATLYTTLCMIAEALLRVGIRHGAHLRVYCASGRSDAYPSGKKASYHVICHTAQVFRCVADHKRFMEGVLLPLARSDSCKRDVMWMRGGVEKCVVDAVPYMTHQNFRLPFQSKWTMGTARPLVPLVCDRIGLIGESTAPWTVGVYEDPVGLEFIGLSGLSGLSGSIRRPLPLLATKLIVDGEESPDYPLIVSLCELLTVEFLGDYEKARNLVWLLWGMETTTRMRHTIHELCAKAPNYSASWVNGLMDNMRFIGFSMGSLRRWAEECRSKEEVDALVKEWGQVITYAGELTKARMAPPRVKEVCVRYLSDTIGGASVFDDGTRTLLIQSHLGTGKTVAIRRILAEGRYHRVLLISPRRSYTHSQCGDLQEMGVVSYLDQPHGWLGAVDKLIVQVESLHRLKCWDTRASHIPDTNLPYDLVVVDESESVLHQLHSVITNGANMIRNHEVMEWALRTAGHVVFADAFLSDRTFAVAEMIRRGAAGEALFIKNTYQPYQRQAIRLIGKEKDIRIPNLGGFCERIMDALRAGRRVVVLWTSKRQGEMFIQTCLKESGFTYRFYHASSSKEEQEGLQNVHDAWRGIQCLMMTTVITVGISYDPKVDEEEFDEAFLYGSSSAAMPRDIAQALLRVRVLKAQRLTYVLDTRIGYYGVRGFTGVWGAMMEKEDKIIREHPLISWQGIPDWARWNHVYNENEERISKAEYQRVLEMYLGLSGYTLTEETHLADGEVAAVARTGTGKKDKKGKKDTVVPSVADILNRGNPNRVAWNRTRDIQAEEADTIFQKMKRGEATEEMIEMYKKFVFRGAFRQAKGAQEREKIEDIMADCWVTFHLQGNESAFWDIYREKRMTLDDILRGESEKRFAVMTTGRAERRRAIDRFLGLVGMRHSQEKKVFGPERLEELGAKLSGAEREIRQGLGIRTSRRKKDSGWTVSNTIDFIRQVLYHWGLSVVHPIEERIRIGDGKRIRSYSLEINKGNKLWSVLRCLLYTSPSPRD